MEQKSKYSNICEINASNILYPKIKAFKITFPSGYQFILKVPQQIKVIEMTQIVKNYTILHQTHGLKVEGRFLQPIILSSTSKNLIADIFMSDQNCGKRQMGCIGENQFRLQYSFREHCMEGFPVRKYQLLGKVKIQKQKMIQAMKVSQFIYISRNRLDCKLYGLTKIDKTSLDFHGCQKVILLTSFAQRAVKDRNNQFVEVKQCFQTLNNVFLVKSLQPFHLTKLKINDKQLMDLILIQIARTLHVLQRDQIQIKYIQLQDFWLDFELKIQFFNIQKLDFKKNKINFRKFQQDNQLFYGDRTLFNERMSVIFEQLFKNCSLKLIQSYIPLFHWLKNSRINNYLQFLKYSQISPNIIFSPHEQQKFNQILSSLITNYNPDGLIQVDDLELQQFKKDYLPKTNIFLLKKQKQEVVEQIKNIEKVKQLGGMDFDILQNISTVKKKIKQKFNQHKPISDRNRRKNKKKGKSESIIRNCKLRTEMKKCKNKISQFLIDD